MRSWVKVIMESVSIALLAIVVTVMCYVTCSGIAGRLKKSLDVRRVFCKFRLQGELAE